MSLPQVSLVLVSSSSLISTFLSNTLTEEDLKVFKDLSSGPTTEGAATSDLDTARMQGILSTLVDSFRQLPPTRSALYSYHALRSAYVSGHLQGQADLFAPELPAFVDWGWEEVLDLEDPNAFLLPTWSIMLDISGAYEKLSKICNCGDKIA